MANLPNKSFLLNYNARDYNPATHSIPKTTGQLFDQDLVLNTGVTAYTDTSLSINGQYMGYTFQSTGSNIFNRSGQDSLTIVAKTSKGLDNSGEHSIFSNRGSGLNYLLFNPANGADKTIVFLHNSERLYNNCPYVRLSADTNIYAIRVEGGSGYGQSYTDEQTFATVTNSWGGSSNKIGFFYDSYSQGGFEGWRGEFYWLYISNEALTTEEIEQVIAYNENRLSVQPDTIAATSAGSAYTVNVSADTEVTWTASTSDSWIGLSSPTGTGNGSFTVNIPANPEYAARSGEISVVSSDEGEATIAVSQEKKAAIFTRRDIYRSGNQVNKMYRSGELIFQRIEPEIPPTPSGYSNQYLTFEILSAGTINWKSTNSGFTRTVQYSKNNGDTWNLITSTTAGTPLNVAAGDKVLFRGNNDAYGSLENGDCTFSGTTAKFNVEGNIMSLINSTNFSNLDSLSSAYTFSSLFRYCTGLTDASNLILPATTLAVGCYDSMFLGCKSLTVGPELPATTLRNGCYSWMFTACYSLTTAPALPAETLSDYCYHSMFASCSGLTQAPELPATTLGLYCYQYMFSNCKSLNYVKCLATDISATYCTYSWLNNVASAGTFVKAASMTDWTRGNSGIPVGWTVQDAS